MRSSKGKINIEYINPFIIGAGMVFNSLVKVDLKKGKVIMIDKIVPAHEVIINIEIEGAINGFVVYSLGFYTIKKMAEVIVPGLSDEQIQYEYKDIVGEIGNMITGNAFSILEGKNIDLSTPVVMDRKDFMVAGFSKFTGLAIKLYSVMGPLEICIVMR